MGDKVSWIDANGVEHDLTSTTQWIKTIGWTGRFMPPVSFVEDQVPYKPGSHFRELITSPRDVDIPILVKGPDSAGLRNNIRQLLQMFNPGRGEGRLRVTGPDGYPRDLYCRYSGGMEGQEDQNTNPADQWMTVVISFHAFDPYWYGSQTQVQTFTPGQPATFFPFFPLRLSSSQVFADVTIDNQGDVEAWPVWAITGPGADIVLQNQTTGESISLNVTLAEGESLTIDTTPGNKTVTKNDGSNLYGSMTFDSSLWALVSGNNSVEIQMANATSGSSVQLTYHNRYLGA